MAGRQVAWPAGQHLQLAVQALQQRMGREQMDPCRGQFERQRNALQTRADLDDRANVRGGDHEIVLHGLSARDEQAHRFVLHDRFQRRQRL